jgi:hypothetical protein
MLKAFPILCLSVTQSHLSISRGSSRMANLTAFFSASENCGLSEFQRCVRAVLKAVDREMSFCFSWEEWCGVVRRKAFQR